MKVRSSSLARSMKETMNSGRNGIEKLRHILKPVNKGDLSFTHDKNQLKVTTPEQTQNERIKLPVNEHLNASEEQDSKKIHHPLRFPLLWFIVFPIGFVVLLLLYNPITLSIHGDVASPRFFYMFTLIIAAMIYVMQGTIHYGSLSLVFGDHKSPQWKIKQALLEYNFIRKYVYVVLPIVIFLLSISYSPWITSLISTKFGIDLATLFEYGVFVGVPLTLSYYGAFFSLIRVILRKNYRFDYSGAFFRAIDLEKMTDIEKMQFVVSGFDEYQKYLQRKTKVRIGNSGMVYAKITVDSEKMNDAIKKISKMFEEYDTLGLYRYVLKDVKSDDAEILHRVTRTEAIRDFAPLIVTLIPTTITIIGIIITWILKGTPEIISL